jgi:hypothetical protein
MAGNHAANVTCRGKWDFSVGFKHNLAFKNLSVEAQGGSGVKTLGGSLRIIRAPPSLLRGEEKSKGHPKLTGSLVPKEDHTWL